MKIGSGGLVWVADDLVSNQLLLKSSGQQATAASVLATHGFDGDASSNVPMLCVPDVIGELVKRKCWVELFLLGRWPRLFPDWPSDSWIADNSGRHYESRPALLNTDRLVSLANDLRRWSPQIIASASAILRSGCVVGLSYALLFA